MRCPWEFCNHSYKAVWLSLGRSHPFPYILCAHLHWRIIPISAIYLCIVQLPALMSQSSLWGNSLLHLHLPTSAVFVLAQVTVKLSQMLTKHAGSPCGNLWPNLWDCGVTPGKIPLSQQGRGNCPSPWVMSWWTTWKATCQSLFLWEAES